MEFRVISLPPFRAASSGLDREMDFSENGVLGKFERYFSAITPSARDSFMPRDFLYYDEENEGFVWIWALAEGMDDGGFEVIEQEGGMYLCYDYLDGDDAERERMYAEALKFLEAGGVLELDSRPGHYGMGHIITPAALIKKQGWTVMESLLPVKFKEA